MYGSNWQQSFRRNFLQGGCPATITIIALSVIAWLFLALSHTGVLIELLAFSTNAWPVPYIWTVFTWPIVVIANPIFVLFAGMFAYSIGGSLERSWGTRNFTIFWLATNAVTAIAVWIGAMLLHVSGGVAGLWVGLAPATVAWCLLNRRESVLFSFVLPIPAIWLAWLTAVLVWWEVGAAGHQPVLGLFALAGCAAAYWYIEKGALSANRHGYRSETKYRASRLDLGPDRESSRRGFSISRYLNDRKERRRLEEIFRRSGFDTDDKSRR